MTEYRTKSEEGQRAINDFTMQKAKLQTENGKTRGHDKTTVATMWENISTTSSFQIVSGSLCVFIGIFHIDSCKPFFLVMIHL